jgi:hypothetical protein
LVEVATIISFFVVDNGDMTLLQLEDSTILIDVRIRSAADDPDDDAPDVSKEPGRR